MWSGNVSLMFIQVHLAQSKSLSPFPMHCYLLCPLWILYDNAFAILLLFSLTSSNSFFSALVSVFFLVKNKIMTRNGAPSCWQRRPARQHWQEVQGWRSFHTWRWSNTEPRVGFWCKEVMLAEEMHFSIKLEIVVLLPPFFCLVCNQNVYDPLIPIKTGERKTSLFRAF